VEGSSESNSFRKYAIKNSISFLVKTPFFSSSTKSNSPLGSATASFAKISRLRFSTSSDESFELDIFR
jgi:hypothetical protein